MVKRILAATDFSLTADAAWALAVDLAVVHEAELLLLHVAMPLASSVSDISETVKDDYDRAIETAERRVTERTWTATSRGLAVKGLVSTGNPAEVITVMARDERVDLVVVGGHPPLGSNEILIGSVAERVVRSADCAVLVVKSELRQAA